eukprot:TRINITY_DN61086_c0_g1_i1.p1 TRINITY_DN61086_c0_g1~~TRINITY_DN61086_c0_g1_i1.p1  ORF type:complete len:488 (+),score=87.41 TRINITY_DN61086_c0_g1_i1:70-1464(+)
MAPAPEGCCIVSKCTFAASDLSGGLLCSSCAPISELAEALGTLKGFATEAHRKRLALDLASGVAEAKMRLEEVAAAKRRAGESHLVIIAEPPTLVHVGLRTTTLTCEAVCIGDTSHGAALGEVQYQWCKDGLPLPRAERSRFMLCGAQPRDEGSYVCKVTCGSKVVTTRPADVRLSEDACAQRARRESPLRRAAEAEAAGDAVAAERLLSNAVAASADADEASRAEVHRLRAELLLRLGRWQDAYRDASEAVKISPSARAQATRGAAAEKLELFAEAASSWEAAEILGGVAEAAERAEACRERLYSFFAEARRTAEQTQPTKEERYDPEASWRRDGWKGDSDAGGGDEGPESSWSRSAGARGGASRGSGFFFGGVGGGYRGSTSGGAGGGGGGRGPSALSAEMQGHLALLGITPGEGPLNADDVRRSYRRLALTAHPDKAGGSKEAFQKLQTAYESVLVAIGEA